MPPSASALSTTTTPSSSPTNFKKEDEAKNLTDSSQDEKKEADNEESSTQVLHLLSAQAVMDQVQEFYRVHTEIKESHGLSHVLCVHRHAQRAIQVHQAPPLTPEMATEIEIAALLHDVDDKKYFPDTPKGQYPNAKQILIDSHIPESSHDVILQMISLVSASSNGNKVPDVIRNSGNYHLLIPRWSDRLEAVGTMGVIRAYQYNEENGLPLFLDDSPRPTTEQEVWKFADPARFEAYQTTGSTAPDMIAHYYDKLLHIARPPVELVRNSYLEQTAAESAAPLVQVCLHFGTTGTIDVPYIEALIRQSKMEEQPQAV